MDLLTPRLYRWEQRRYPTPRAYIPLALLMEILMTVGTSFIVNSTTINIGTLMLIANTLKGVAGQILTSNAIGGTYWAKSSTRRNRYVGRDG